MTRLLRNSFEFPAPLISLPVNDEGFLFHCRMLGKQKSSKADTTSSPCIGYPLATEIKFCLHIYALSVVLEVACSSPSRWEAGRIIAFEFVRMDLHAYMEVVLTSLWFSLSGCCLYQWPEHSCAPHGHSWQPPTSTPQSGWPPVAVTASPSLERFFPEWSACR